MNARLVILGAALRLALPLLAPATSLAHVVAESSRLRPVLSNVSGAVWNGQTDWWLEPHSSRWQTQWLSGLGTPWNTLQLDGALQLQQGAWQGHVARQRASASGELDAQVLDMTTRLSTLRPVGSYALQLRSTAQRSSLELSTLRGDLLLQGQGQWVGGRLRFTGEASASPEREAALANLLNIIGRRQGSRSVIQIG